MADYIEKPTGLRDLMWLGAIAVATSLLTFFLLSHLQLRFELYDAAQERAHQAWQQRQLIFQGEHLELERRYRARGLDWSDDGPTMEGLRELSADQSVELEAE